MVKLISIGGIPKMERPDCDGSQAVFFSISFSISIVAISAKFSAKYGSD
jgi:hypothetical protein